MYKKKEKPEEHVNLERWLLTYSDMITLLMVFFIMLYAMSMLDMAKFDKAKSGFQKAFNNLSTPGILPGGKSVFGEGDATATEPLVVFNKFVESSENPNKPVKHEIPEASSGNEIIGEVDLKKMGTEEALKLSGADKELIYIAKNIIDNIKGTIHDNDVSLLLEKRGLVIRIKSEGILFDSGSANLREDVFPLLDIIVKSLKFYNGMIIIEGHTDNVPINTVVYPSNWELSTARAASVLKHWIENNMLSPKNVMAAGFADTRPVVSNASIENRAKNRRVEILILNKEDAQLMKN
jgi:chemotaxis protein MotB